jgi:hypothetical protein
VPVESYLEIGSKRVFAGAIDWPGWSRSGRDEEAALQALFAYGPRYRDALRRSEVAFTLPAKPSALRVVQRLKGDATTDFGAPSIAPAADARSVDRRWLSRQTRILRACWAAFDHAAANVRRALAKGPRGGGRELEGIVGHVIGAEASYVRMIGGKVPAFETPPIQEPGGRAALEEERGIVLEALERAVVDGIPEGPRGGKRWSAPYFVRRAAWHVLDHAWEIEDRSS